jgi:hypothetical protein
MNLIKSALENLTRKKCRPQANIPGMSANVDAYHGWAGSLSEIYGHYNDLLDFLKKKLKLLENRKRRFIQYY